MYQNEFINKISERTGFTRDECKDFIQSFEDVVTEAMQDGDSVMLPGFCSFDTYMRKAHYTNNIMLYNDDYHLLPDCKIVRIRAGKRLKRAARETDKVTRTDA